MILTINKARVQSALQSTCQNRAPCSIFLKCGTVIGQVTRFAKATGSLPWRPVAVKFKMAAEIGDCQRRHFLPTYQTGLLCNLRRICLR